MYKRRTVTAKMDTIDKLISINRKMSIKSLYKIIE